jgi:gluconolactonase
VPDLEALCWGYGLIEGPRVDAAGNLYFSDVPNGGVYRRSPDGEVTVAVPKRRGVGGIAVHRDGGVVVGGRNIVHVRNGENRVLFEKPEGSTGFNDLFPDAAGRVIVGTFRTDPFATSGKRVDGECWRIESEGQAVQLYGEVTLTNGIGLSPEGRTIYHSDTARKGVWAHDLSDDGKASNARFAVQSDDLEPDGLAVDEAGTIWIADVSGSRSVRGFTPGGGEVGRIPVPAKMITSLCFGGSDRRDMYIVTADNTDDRSREGTVFRTRVDVPGLPVAEVTI